VAEHHQRSIGKIVAVHTPRLAQLPFARKLLVHDRII
jgi:hypothetical protein